MWSTRKDRSWVRCLPPGRGSVSDGRGWSGPRGRSGPSRVCPSPGPKGLPMGLLHTLGAPGRDIPGTPVGAPGHGQREVKTQESCGGGPGAGSGLLAMRTRPRWGPPWQHTGWGGRAGQEGSSRGPGRSSSCFREIDRLDRAAVIGASCTEVVSSRPDRHYGVCAPSDRAQGWEARQPRGRAPHCLRAAALDLPEPPPRRRGPERLPAFSELPPRAWQLSPTGALTVRNYYLHFTMGTLRHRLATAAPGASVPASSLPWARG